MSVQADKRGQETNIIQLGAVTQKVSLLPAKYCNFHFIAGKIPSGFLKSTVKIQLQNFWNQRAPKHGIIR